jgi:lactate dehydrogenase-like 2-hydroxyacid dehydrogenase
LLTRRWPAAAERAIASRYDVHLNELDRAMSAHDLADALRNFDIVCPTVTDRIDRSLLDGGQIRARALCNYGAGCSHIDVGAFTASNIIVTNTPDVLTDDTADFTIMLALMCARRASEGERLARKGGWQGWAPTDLLGTRISGKTLGIIGFGRIGQAVARRARNGFGMNILYASRNPAPEQIEQELEARHAAIDDLFAISDVVSLHLPGGPQTRHLVDARRLALMQRSAILINTARGEIVDEQALADALRNGTIRAAGLDVYEGEPEIFPELFGLENVVLLPHLGSATHESRVAMGMRVLANIDAIATGASAPDRIA